MKKQEEREMKEMKEGVKIYEYLISCIA